MASHQLITRKQLNAREQEWFKSTKDTFERSVQQQRLRVSHTGHVPELLLARGRCWVRVGWDCMLSSPVEHSPSRHSSVLAASIRDRAYLPHRDQRLPELARGVGFGLERLYVSEESL